MRFDTGIQPSFREINEFGDNLTPPLLLWTRGRSLVGTVRTGAPEVTANTSGCTFSTKNYAESQENTSEFSRIWFSKCQRWLITSTRRWNKGWKWRTHASPNTSTGRCWACAAPAMGLRGSRCHSNGPPRHSTALPRPTFLLGLREHVPVFQTHTKFTMCSVTYIPMQ